MDPAWKDGILSMARAAKRGIDMALEDDEMRVVRSVVATILIAEREGA